MGLDEAPPNPRPSGRARCRCRLSRPCRPRRDRRTRRGDVRFDAVEAVDGPRADVLTAHHQRDLVAGSNLATTPLASWPLIAWMSPGSPCPGIVIAVPPPGHPRRDRPEHETVAPTSPRHGNVANLVAEGRNAAIDQLDLASRRAAAKAAQPFRLPTAPFPCWTGARMTGVSGADQAGTSPGSCRRSPSDSRSSSGSARRKAPGSERR